MPSARTIVGRSPPSAGKKEAACCRAVVWSMACHATGAAARTLSAVLAYALDWLNLLVRWLHVTAAIAWIGTSFYYIALDYHLLPTRDANLAGEVWEIHGGG